MVATRGITAGAGFAALELRLFLLDCMTSVNETSGVTLTAKLYVDDLTLAVYGQARMVIDVLVAALEFVINHFQVTLSRWRCPSRSR